jgi:hypothetical protein
LNSGSEYSNFHPSQTASIAGAPFGIAQAAPLPQNGKSSKISGGAKMFFKGDSGNHYPPHLPVGSRRNSQDKMSHHNTSSAHHSNSMMGNGGVGGNSSYQAHYQENLNKNRPQTSYRLATKNTFQAVGGANGSASHNTSMTNIH